MEPLESLLKLKSNQLELNQTKNQILALAVNQRTTKNQILEIEQERDYLVKEKYALIKMLNGIQFDISLLEAEQSRLEQLAGEHQSQLNDFTQVFNSLKAQVDVHRAQHGLSCTPTLESELEKLDQERMEEARNKRKKK